MQHIIENKTNLKTIEFYFLIVLDCKKQYFGILFNYGS